MSKFIIEDAQISKSNTFQPLVSGDTPEVVNIAASLGKVAEWYDEISDIKTTIGNINSVLEEVL